MKAALIPLIVTLCICAACDKPAAAPPVPPVPPNFCTAGEQDGVKYDVRGTGPVTTVATEKLIKISFDSQVLEIDIKNKQLRLNGRDHGPVKRGDRVVLTPDGRLSVDGEMRPPLS